MDNSLFLGFYLSNLLVLVHLLMSIDRNLPRIYKDTYEKRFCPIPPRFFRELSNAADTDMKAAIAINISFLAAMLFQR